MLRPKCVAVIPARAGSKRVPQKNLREVGGKPLVQIAVEQAVASKVFEDVIVSTDSQEILGLSLEAGASPFPLRPVALSGDDSTSHEAVRLVIGMLPKGRQPDFVYTLPPTSPFRTSKHIVEAHNLLRNTRLATGVLSCVDVPSRYSIEKQMYEAENHFLVPVNGELPAAFETVRVQPRLARNSAIYGVRAEYLDSGLAGNKPVAYIMPALDSIDIDTEEDWRLACAIAQFRGTGVW